MRQKSQKLPTVHVGDIFMKKILNIKNRAETEEVLFQLKNKKYLGIDVRFSNVHLIKINTLLGFNLFKKNDLFANSEKLWEIMQPVGNTNEFNSHGLTPKEIIDVLNSLSNPYCFYNAKYGRYGIVSLIIGECGEPLIVIIEVGASTFEDKNANINKLVTMYPKDNINDLLSKMNEKDVLYYKQKAQ